MSLCVTTVCNISVKKLWYPRAGHSLPPSIPLCTPLSVSPWSLPACPTPSSLFSHLSLTFSLSLSLFLILSHALNISPTLWLCISHFVCLSFAHEPASWPRMSSWLLPDQRWTGCCKKVTDVRVIAISLFVGLSSPLMSFPTKKIFINSNKRPRFFTATEFSLFTFSNVTAIRESCIYELASQTTHPAASSIEKFYRCFMTGRIFDGVIATEMSQTMSRLEMTGSSAY